MINYLYYFIYYGVRSKLSDSNYDYDLSKISDTDSLT